MTASAELATFAAGLDVDHVDAWLLRKLKRHLLDTIGVACAGVNEQEPRAVGGVLQRWGGVPESTAIGCPTRLPAPKAAFLNAVAARILTFDDTYEAGPIHPGSAVVAATLAVAERAGASGRTLIAALLAGYETATRVAKALGPEHYRSGFHASGTCAPFGAAAAAARVLGLNAEETTSALGLAGEAAIGLRQHQLDGSLFDSALNAARGAELGVTAVEFAAAGLTGPKGVLDGRWGVLAMMSQTGDPAALTSDLGTTWVFAETSLKPFASCRFTHGPIAALRDAGITSAEVEEIEIAAFRESYDVSNRPNPETRFDAILSHQLAAALAISGRPIMPTEFVQIDPAIRDLAARVRVTHDPSLDQLRPQLWPHRITVRLKNGRVLNLPSDQPPEPTEPDAQAKFRLLAGPVLGEDRVAKLIILADALEGLPNIREFTELLGGTSS